MRGRCERHQLALGPNGCVLCRREPAATAPLPSLEDAAHPAAEPQSAPSGAGSDALGTPSAVAQWAATRETSAPLPKALLLLAVVAAGASFFAGGESRVSSRRSSPAPLEQIEPAQEPAETGTPPDERPPAARRRLPPLVIEELAVPAQRALGDTAQAATASGPTAARADGSSSRSLERARQEVEARELATLRERVDVVVYSTSWCPACRSLRAYLAKHGIRATEYDVESDRNAQRRQRLLNPRGSVPTVDIEGQVLVGFDPRSLETALDRAARARLQRL